MRIISIFVLMIFLWITFPSCGSEEVAGVYEFSTKDLDLSRGDDITRFMMISFLLDEENKMFFVGGGEVTYWGDYKKIGNQLEITSPDTTLLFDFKEGDLKIPKEIFGKEITFVKKSE